MKTYSTIPDSIFHASVLRAPVDLGGDMANVFNLETVGFFTIKDISDNMKECLASVKAEYLNFDISLDGQELAELEGYMQEFLNEYSVLR